MPSASNAHRGDIVRNLSTGDVGTVVGSKQDGRLIVATNTLARERGLGEAWERWNVEVLSTPEGKR